MEQRRSTIPARTDGLEVLAALADPVRRRLYLHLAAASGPVSRDEASATLGISRALAAFHLERLLAAGLVSAEFPQREAGARRRRGRPVKLYKPARRQLEVSVPPRRYELAAALLGEALASVDRPPSLDAAARARGVEMGIEAKKRAGPRPPANRLVAEVEAVLEDEGFGPARDMTGTICLRNCPFDSVARQQRDVVCPTNLSLLQGLISGASADLSARLAPEPGRCCVVLEPGEAAG